MAVMPGSFCTICRTRISSGSRCSRHRLQSPSTRSWHQPGAAALRERVLKRDGYRCVYCGAADDGLEVHHVVPVAEGGKNGLSNVVVVCRACHANAHPEPPTSRSQN
jgi:5-methylcytosine-specific restriction endonuclease McrA